MKDLVKIAITVDWDFFADTDAYDFGHRENAFFINHMWNLRLEGNPDLVNSFQLAENRKDFWAKLKKFGLLPPLLIVSESHCVGYKVHNSFPPDILINFDSHHDLWNAKEGIFCQNWVFELLRKRKRMKYIWVVPPWRNLRECSKTMPRSKIPNNLICTRLGNLQCFLPSKILNIVGTICRSGAWMPPWLDQEFSKFLIESTARIMDDPNIPLIERSFKIPSKEEHEEYLSKIRQLRKGTKGESK